MVRDIYGLLVRDALYAIRSNDDHLVHQCYGASTMAYELDAITDQEYERLRKALIPGWVNNVANRKRLAETITEDDIRG